MIINLNGKLVNEKVAMISAYDHGFLYGIGLFETFRTLGGKPFLLEQHLQRLADGCRELGIEYLMDAVEIEAQISELLQINELDDAYVRLTVSAGEQALGLTSEPYRSPNIIIYIKPLPDLSDKLYEQGKLLQRIRVARNTPEGAMRLKSLHFMNNLLAYRELSSMKWLEGRAAEGIMLDQRGYIAEGITSNVFWVRDGKLHTPSLDTGILPGVTRRWVIEQATCEGTSESTNGVFQGVTQGLYEWEQLIGADEVFVTNSIQGIIPIYGIFDIDGTWTTIGQGVPGEYTREILQKYKKAMMEQCLTSQ